MSKGIRTFLVTLLGGALVGFFTVGCASIMQGTTQSVGISSSPTGADVTVNGETLGRTPLVADLKRKDNHIIRIETDGYEPYEATMSRSVSGWVVGNIIFGGLIGLAVDAISGGMYKLTPEQVEADMGQRVAHDPESDALYVTVVLRPDPEWEKVGELTPAAH